MMRNYIGLAHSFHDSALAIVNAGGEVVFAEGTERPLQCKRALCIAPDLVHHVGEIIRKYCDRDAEIVLARSWKSSEAAPPEAALRSLEQQRRLLEERFVQLPEGLRTEIVATKHGILSMWKARAFAGHSIEFELDRIGWKNAFIARDVGYDHHLTHAAAACFSSPFANAVCAVVDALGEEVATAYFSYRDGRLTPFEVQSGAPGVTGFGSLASLGLFFIKVCLACGFGVHTGEEWKVMGLAAYGTHDEELLGVFRGMIAATGLSLEATGDPIPERLALYELRCGALASQQRAADIALAGQQVFKETLMELLNNLHRATKADNLVLGGGCALNSSANGAVLHETRFSALHTFCAPADDGNAVGAALLAYLEDHPDAKPRGSVLTPYLGSRMEAETLANTLRFSGQTHVVKCGAEAPMKAAEMLAAGKIIGWIQGRAEFGPRALGNRSILADPRSAKVKEDINTRVKFREQFRPFAPAILHEAGEEYFENYQESPYMERTLRFRPEMRARVPGVVHVDGTGRLQTVKEEWNAPFYRLIRHFYRLTGVPLVLNTSFNVMGKPIAHSVEDVLAVLFSTGLDAVFVEELLIEK
jgi:carbamoyltransferase